MKTIHFALILFLLLACAHASAENVMGRYVRYEAPVSLQIEVREVEVFSNGENVAPKMGKCITIDADGVHPVTNKVFVDGDKDVARRGPNLYGSAYFTDKKRFPNPVLDPVLEMDLGQEIPIEKVIVYRSGAIAKTYMDKYKRQLTILDSKRRVVAINRYDVLDKPHFAGSETSVIIPAPSNYAGKVVPEGTQQWLKMGDFFDLPQLPPLSPDEQVQMDAFNKRNSPEALEKLAREFFARVDLDKPVLRPISDLYKAGKYTDALNAFKIHFFKRLERMRDVVLWYPDIYTYDLQGEDMLDGVLVTFTDGGAFGQRIRPGSIKWVDIPDEPGARAKAIADTERRAWPDTAQRPLLMAYTRTGNKRYLDGWCAISDDWAMNFARQADASPYNVRSMFVMTPFFSTSTFFKDLDNAAKAHPEFVEQFPATTLARMLMPMVEEYPPAFWRVARKCVFNHIINAWGDALLPIYILNDFYAGERAERENRQHFERLWDGLAYMRDGYTVEMCDEGHSMAPFWSTCMYQHLKQNNYDWLTPDYEDTYFDGLKKVARFVVKNLGPGGYSEYMDRYRSGFGVAWYHSGLTEWYQKDYYFGYPAKITKPVLFEPEIRAVMDTCFGKGREESTIKNDQKKDHASLVDFYEGSYQGAPKVVSENKPYSGFQYLRKGFARGDSFVLMLTHKTDTMNAGSAYDSTFFRYMDYDMPMLEAAGVWIDGQKQNLDYQKKTYDPGSKQTRMGEASEKPIPARWLTSPKFDFSEVFYEGAYQNKGIKDGKIVANAPAIEGVTARRQMIQVRDYRLFIATDRVTYEKGSGKHECSINYSVQLPQKKGDEFSAAKQFVADPAKGLIQMRNPHSPGLTIAQFASTPIKQQIQNGKDPVHLGDQSAHQFGDDILFAERKINVTWQAAGPSALVTLLAPNPAGAESSPDWIAPGVIKSIEPKSKDGATGFVAQLADGGTLTYQATTAKPLELDMNGVKATAEALLVIEKSKVRSGVAVGVKTWTVDGKSTAVPYPDFEFTLKADGSLETATPILYPVAPVEVFPHERVFTDSVKMELKTDTPDTEIHYTVDGSEPDLKAPVYSQPILLDKDTYVKARAVRKGTKEMPVDTSGTLVSEISRGHFFKRGFVDAITPVPALQPGLKYEYFESNWFRLYSYANLPGVLPAQKSGVTQNLLDVSPRTGDGPFGMRYSGYLQIPADGVYTFYGPKEFVHNIYGDPGYDLRVYVDGEEWYLGQTWHGLGCWSIPLKAGAHRLLVTFADARAKDLYKQKRDLWRDYPNPWIVWEGVAPTLEISGPTTKKQPIPQDWLKHD